MLHKIKHLIALDNPLRLAYHKTRAIIANFYYGFPSKDMVIIWVTWTNWKTTTCNLIAKWFIENWEDVFMFSTVNIIMWKEEFTNKTKMTSPDAFELQRLLKIAKQKWIKKAIIETASHWIKYNRIWWINYDTVVLTNITQDHLDLHRTMDDYVNTKLQIFKNLISYKRKKDIKKTAVINIDSNYSELFIDETYDSLYTYWENPNSTIEIKNIKEEKDYTYFDLNILGENLNFKTKLRGIFNVYNITAAIWVFMSFWLSKEKIIDIVKHIKGIPWRLEEVINTEWYQIFIDYAHTADALEKVLNSLNKIKWNWRIITVFWATWDRDKSKRPIMGQIVSNYSDFVILTQDDDYSENTTDIIKDVLPWIERAEWEDFWIIPNREEAIRTALITWKKWDIILIAWKGDEHVMVTQKWIIPWHDKTKVEEILKGLDENKIIES